MAEQTKTIASNNITIKATLLDDHVNITFSHGEGGVGNEWATNRLEKVSFRGGRVVKAADFFTGLENLTNVGFEGFHKHNATFTITLYGGLFGDVTAGFDVRSCDFLEQEVHHAEQLKTLYSKLKQERKDLKEACKARVATHPLNDLVVKPEGALTGEEKELLGKLLFLNTLLGK